MAITTQGCYITCANLLWFDLFQSAIPAVPLSRQRLQELGDWYFRDGHSFFTAMILAATPSAESMTEMPKLRCVSPEEQLHAVVYAAAKHLPDCDDEMKLQWKRTLPPGSLKRPSFQVVKVQCTLGRFLPTEAGDPDHHQAGAGVRDLGSMPGPAADDQPGERGTEAQRLPTGSGADNHQGSGCG